MEIKVGSYSFPYEFFEDYSTQLEDLNSLKDHLLDSSEFERLPKKQQAEIYHYCWLHATHPVCLKNIEQIKFAVLRLYFDGAPA